MIYSIHKKTLFQVFAGFVICLILVLGWSQFGDAKEPTTKLLDESVDVRSDKTWTITFNKAIARATINSHSVYVLDASGRKVNGKLTVSADGKEVFIMPPLEGYKQSATYNLYVTQLVKDDDGRALNYQIQKRFTIASTATFDVATVQSNGSTSVVKSYPTYKEAIANVGAHHVILHKGGIIKMPAGIVVTKPTSASVLTTLYLDKELKKEETYVADDTEFHYIDSTEHYVEVNVAGKSRFIKHENSRLFPWNAVQYQSFYYTTNGALYHSVYTASTGNYGTYQAGIAPSFMRDGDKYYSMDGSHFITKDGVNAGIGYQYFQYLPVRSVTKYTAQEIDAYIMKRLKQLETTFPNHKEYAQAASKSKLIGIGELLKKIEKEQQINALHILALAQHESNYGLTTWAQQYNNLFGLYVYDDNPDHRLFESVEQNIRELVTIFLNKNYIPPNAKYANGAIFGNKAIGFNIKYASDPYWGSKAAGHLYRIDQMMGGKDIANPFKLGLTNRSGLNVRTGPGTNYPIAFTYDKSEVPLIIIDDMLPEKSWIKIQSDSLQYEELYVHRSYVEELPVP
ncbi:glucosaminidase domain-containing protein [Sporosarcina sp. YIM B06819]|uniref:glucosaminidase domain-containing protein n=1 Tax=Sporosarcina sp. YIM B06819 TaxID=3081769 RepID=UPI00298C1810|nr:glucosaminidase domain-containing protein [Sporosarcina sp. YIM B06819]